MDTELDLKTASREELVGEITMLRLELGRERAEHENTKKLLKSANMGMAYSLKEMSAMSEELVILKGLTL
jgi:hypothetical protein